VEKEGTFISPSPLVRKKDTITTTTTTTIMIILYQSSTESFNFFLTCVSQESTQGLVIQLVHPYEQLS